MTSVMGKIIERFSSYPVFTYSDIKLYLGGVIDDNSLRVLLSYMTSKKKLYRVRKASYTFKKDEMMAGYAFEPFYFGLFFAMTCRGVWDQLPHVCIVTTKQVRKSRVGLFREEDFWVDLHHVPFKYFFGFSSVFYNGFEVPVSDAEKTLIDFVYFKTTLSSDDYALLCRRVDRNKLVKYLSVYDDKTRKSVLKIFEKYSVLQESHY
ncbi:MAG: hypothetical protein M1594_01325 [Candidatus Marsarchaeota archaeon]|nr:hypothetical protein [Candidatus Marsarchaeota archaeon]